MKFLGIREKLVRNGKRPESPKRVSAYKGVLPSTALEVIKKIDNTSKKEKG